MNFDLNLNNYKKSELEDMFDLPENYKESDLNIRAEILKKKISEDRSVDADVRKRTLEFLLHAKMFLLEGLKKILSDYKLENNIYNTDLNLRSSAIISENGSNFIIDRAANSTPYNYSYPGDTFPGIINPLKKRTIIKNLNIDTRFRDNYYTTVSTNFHFDLPYNFNSVTTMQLTSFEFIQSYYTIADCLGNNFFSLQMLDSEGNPTGNLEFIVLADGNYSGQNLMAVLNAIVKTFTTSSLQYVCFSLNEAYGPNGNDRVTIGIDPTYVGPTFNFSVNFLLDVNGNIDSVPLQQKLGWIMGFRSPVYLGENNYTSEAVLDLSGPKYLFLVVDDFNNNVNQNFFGAFNSSMLQKNILARLAIGPNVGSPFVTLDTVASGSFLTPRIYFGPVDIQKLHVQLLDEYGRVLNLNGTDFSFVLALTTAYDI